MDLNELPIFAARQEKRFTKLDAGKHTHLERTYAQLAKTGEEYGELCEQVLGIDGHQRSDKEGTFDNEKLGSEIADVIISLSVIAAHLEVDLSAVLEKKIAIINERFKHLDE